jgi:hypothetical protein
MKADLKRKRRRRILRLFYILVLTSVFLATGMLGVVPDNPLSLGIRQVLANGLPPEFTGNVNEQLGEYALPTLPPADAPELVFDPIAQLLGDAVPPSSPEPTSVPAFTNMPLPTLTAILPASVPTMVSIPTQFVVTESQLDFARQWYIEYPSGEREDFTIEKQDDAFVVTSIENSIGVSELTDQSWDGKTLTWKYKTTYPNGSVLFNTIETKELVICGCGSLGFTLHINLVWTSSDGTSDTMDDLTLTPVYELVSNADYSGTWKAVWSSLDAEVISDHFTIEKLGDVYIITSSSSDLGDSPIIYQAWDGKVLEWQYTAGGQVPFTMKTIGMDKAGILVVSRSTPFTDPPNVGLETGLIFEP